MPALSGLFYGDSMDRQIVYPGQILPETSLLQMAKDSMIGVAKLSAAMFGTGTMANGFAVTPTGPASLQVVCAPGEIYSLTSIDALAFSTLPADTTHSIMKQGILLDGVTLSCPAPGTTGQSINYLVQVTYQDSDSAPVLLPYYNSANPALPYSGAGNNGLTQNTNRKGVAVVAVKAGASAVTGSQVAPAPDAGYAGLYVVTVAFGQTTITAGSITQYSGAPLLPAGLIQSVQGGLALSANDIGAANAYAANFSPAITALVDKMRVCIKVVNPNTTASTFTPAPGVIAPAPIVGAAHAALQGGEMVATGDAWLQWNSSVGAGSWILTDSTGGAVQVANATKSQHAPQFSQIATVAGAFKNLKASTTGLDANISVSADEIVLESAANLYVTLRSVALTINSATVGANGLDTGTLAASTWYSVWTIWNGTTKAGLISLSATAPTLPSGYTHMARTGWIRTDGTANKYPLSFIQVGRVSAYKPASGSNVTGCPVMTSGAQGNISTPTWLAISTANFVPPTACGIDLVLAVFSATTNAGNSMAAPSNGYGAFNSTTNPPPMSFGASVAYNTSMKSRFILESGNIYYASNNTTASLQCVGWEDNL